MMIMDNPILMEEFELRLSKEIEKAHKQGLSYCRLIWILLDLAMKLHPKMEAEIYLKGDV